MAKDRKFSSKVSTMFAVLNTIRHSNVHQLGIFIEQTAPISLLLEACSIGFRFFWH